MEKFTENDNVLDVSFDLALNKQAREEINVYDIVLKHESGSEENTIVEYELSLKESGATLAVKIPKYYFSRLGVYSVAVKLSQRDDEVLSGRSRIEASQPLCTVVSLHRDMGSGKTEVELMPFGGTTLPAEARPVSVDINSLLNTEIDLPIALKGVNMDFVEHHIFFDKYDKVKIKPTLANALYIIADRIWAFENDRKMLNGAHHLIQELIDKGIIKKKDYDEFGHFIELPD